MNSIFPKKHKIHTDKHFRKFVGYPKHCGLIYSSAYTTQYFGFDSFARYEDAQKYANMCTRKYPTTVVKCVIPKGCYYYTGLVEMYCSEKIQIIEYGEEI